MCFYAYGAERGSGVIGVLSPLGETNFTCGLLHLLESKTTFGVAVFFFLPFFILLLFRFYWHCRFGNNEFTFMALSCYESCMSPPSSLLSRLIDHTTS